MANQEDLTRILTWWKGSWNNPSYDAPDCGPNYVIKFIYNYEPTYNPDEAMEMWHDGDSEVPKVGDRLWYWRTNQASIPEFVPRTIDAGAWYGITLVDTVPTAQFSRGYPYFFKYNSTGYVTEIFDGKLCKYEEFSNASLKPYDNIPPDCKVPLEVIIPVLVSTSNQKMEYKGVQVGSAVRKHPSSIPIGTTPPYDGNNKWYILRQGLAVKIGTNGTITDISRNTGCNPPVVDDPVEKECSYNLNLVSPNSLLALCDILGVESPCTLTKCATVAAVPLPANFTSDFNRSLGTFYLKAVSIGSGVTINSCDNVYVEKDGSGAVRFEIRGGTSEMREAMSYTIPPGDSWIKFAFESNPDSNTKAITYNFTPNDTAYERNIVMQITIGNAVINVTINQEKADYYFNTSPTSIIALEEGRTGTLNVSTNASWKVESNRSWLIVNKDPYDFVEGDMSLSYEVLPNTNLYDRSGAIEFNVLGFSTETVSAQQEGTADNYYLVTLTPTRPTLSDACNASVSNSYYSKNSSTLSGSQGLYTDSSGNNPVPNGWYSDGNIARQTLGGSLGPSQICQ